jgi:hypothetical protein
VQRVAVQSCTALHQEFVPLQFASVQLFPHRSLVTGTVLDSGQQNAGFLEQFADGSAEVGQRVVDAEQFPGVAVGNAHGVIAYHRVRTLEHTAGERIGATERRLRMPPDQQQLGIAVGPAR